MTEGKDAGTPPQDTGPPDQAETDPAALSSSEDLDEDRLRVDPLEEGVEPPERTAAVDRYGTTPFEEHQGEDLEQRLAQEQPDTPATGLDETLEQETTDAESVAPPEPGSEDREIHTPAERGGQHADEAGGSVADALRTPRRPAPGE
ncbi:hypothetical protein [Amycolatopsis cihanbeyliensis]|uniref:DUF5709 domain-containing protein n=1 Tax=Amycolatopsis cihanbeyliensis TaxID=1128664 RepID=A0A542DMI3_AMYCI|nr:hypothetical protein [Amycolatopsis cihanbeyliensis]TQJ04296.1 hypothetical protein FB471_4082 [Amycolatopsis cihanbeyliensis]